MVAVTLPVPTKNKFMSSLPVLGAAPDLIMALTIAVVALLASNVICHVPEGNESEGEFGTRTEHAPGPVGGCTFIGLALE